MREQYYTLSSYNNNRSYGAIPEIVREDAESRIGIFDRYILYRTGDNQYTLYVNKVVGTDYYVSYNYNNGYYTNSVGTWTVEEPSLSAPMYSYSNLGYGYTLESNNLPSFMAFCLGGLVVTLFLGIFFKGVIFKCLRR